MLDDFEKEQRRHFYKPGNKASWPAINFVVAATGWKGSTARTFLIESVPTEEHTEVFLAARKWDQECKLKAQESLIGIVGTARIGTSGDVIPRKKTKKKS